MGVQFPPGALGSAIVTQKYADLIVIAAAGTTYIVRVGKIFHVKHFPKMAAFCSS
jgi:hypothetical protein